MRLVAALAFLALPLSAAHAQDIADLKRGMEATISGTVERITDEDEFRLRDATGAVRIYIGPNAMPVAVGDAISVTGLVDDGFGRMEVYAKSLTLADGSSVTFSHNYD